jgi:hypothetical protein
MRGRGDTDGGAPRAADGDSDAEGDSATGSILRGGEAGGARADGCAAGGAHIPARRCIRRHHGHHHRWESIQRT